MVCRAISGLSAISSRVAHASHSASAYRIAPPALCPHSRGFRQCLSNSITSHFRPWPVPSWDHPTTTCLPYGQQCPTRRKEYAAYRSGSMPHGVIKTKTPTQLLAAPGKLAVYLHTADKYHGFTHRPSPGQKGMDEKAIMASQWPSEPW
jgi:hypothetical protein